MPDWLAAACVCGLAAGAALVLLWSAFTPATPHLSDTLATLRRRPASTTPAAVPGQRTGPDRLGAWVLRHSPSIPGLRIPYVDLDLLGMRPARFHAHKALWAVAGLALPTLVTAWSWLFGSPPDVASPVLVALVLALTGWCAPHLWVRRSAARTRQRFARTITAYIDLVVLERLSGATLATAIIEPASIAEAPLFVRIRQTVSRHQLERKPPWTALRDLADDIDLPDLAELADTLEISGLKGAPMAEQLTARAGDIRNAWLHRDVEAAGAASQRQVAATGLLLFCFLIFVGAPALLRLLAS